MKRVVILTPNPDDMAFEGRWSEVRDRMVGPLNAEGVEVESLAWTEPEDLHRFDLVLPLTVWGYHRDHDWWVESLSGWEFGGLPVLNPPSVLRWNSDKRYLQGFFDRGLPVVPTVFVDRVDQEDLARAAWLGDSSELVVKPQISASAYQTRRIRPGDALVDMPTGPAMIQPYLDAVGTDGELSLIYFDRQFSHAIRKVAAPGDFRVQPEWGGRITPYVPEPDVRAAADAILAAIDEPLLYARVDLVRDAKRAPVLMELELVEPDLYLGFDPQEGRGFARAVRAAIGAG